MAQPAYIIPANYYSNAVVDDVQHILDDLDTLLAANGWTVAGAGGPYTTPVDPAGRWFKLTFTRISATRLDCAMTDDQARVTSTREMQITGTQTINYYYGTRYVYIVNTGQEDTIFATLLSLYPESETVHNRYCVFYGTRTSAGTRTSYQVGCLETVRGDTNAYVAQGTPASSLYLTYGCSQASNTCVNTKHISGARRWYPAWSAAQDTVSTYGMRGRLYNVLLMMQGTGAIGTEYTIPIDQATTGVFKILNITYGITSYYYKAVRKS